MGIFKSTKSDLAAGPDVPLQQVVAMKSQGYSNNQIIQTLQRDGYTSSQIFDAISQAEMGPAQAAVNAQSSQDPQLQRLGQQLPPLPQAMPQQQFQQSQMGVPMQNTEEIIEAIIDEKWNELVKDINKIIEWKQKADNSMSVMQQQLADLRDQFDKLHGAVLGKVGDYDKNMTEVNTQLQAMEKVFSKVLPSFVDNVNELNRITERIKTDKKPMSPQKTGRQTLQQQVNDEE